MAIKIIKVAIIASKIKPAPVATPIAAAAQMIAAVVKPEIASFFLCKITPAPKKPMPLITCAASRIGSVRILSETCA